MVHGLNMLGQAAISNTIAGIIDMPERWSTDHDGCQQALLGPPDSVSKTMTVVSAAGLQAFMSTTTGLGLPLRASCPSTTICGISTTSQAKNQAQAAGTVALAA